MPTDPTQPVRAPRPTRGTNSIRFVGEPIPDLSRSPQADGAERRTPLRPINKKTPESGELFPPLAAPAAAALPLPARSARSKRQPNLNAVPKAIDARFIRVGKTYYYPNGNEAFRDHGTKLTTLSENAELARFLVEIALHRGFGEIKLSGTERFKRQLWRAAFRAGVQVRNYTPSELEKARAVRERAREQSAGRAQPQSSSSTDANIRSNEPSAPIQSRAQEGATRTAVDKGTAPAQAPRNATFSGRLLAHGDAPYRNSPDGGPSYYVTLLTERGERTLWGTDLKRALKESMTQPKIGDQVGVRAIGREPVTIMHKKRDAAGLLVDEPVTTHRNSWVVEKAEHFDQRRRASEALLDTRRAPKIVAHEHPELIGSYITLRAAELLAEKYIVSPGDRRAFLNAIRERLARQIAQGGRLPQVKLRERSPAREHEATPTRRHESERVPA
jgi:Large polyvalent protein-associated domain 7